MKTNHLAFVALWFALLVNVSAQPKISVLSGSTMDMGNVYSGEVVERIALIKNVGSDTLVISEVKAQCGCTATLMTEKILAPNDTGKLSISFNTTGQHGARSKQVYINSNDLENPKFTITFTANVKSVLDINPKTVAFDNSRVDSVYTKNITITNPSETEAVSILSIKPDIPILKVDLMKNKLMPGEQTQLQVTLTPKKSGTMNGKIELLTDNKHQQKFDINVFAFVNRK